MANKTKAWMIDPVTEEVQDYYSAYELLYQGRYSIQKLLTNNELKYAITEEYSYQVSQDIRPWQYYVDIYDVPEDMSLRYLMCTGYVYRFRSPNSYNSITKESNSLYETDFLLYLADNGKVLGIVEVIPNPGVDSSELPLEPPDPYDKHYSDDITGIEQNTIIQFIVGNPITTGADNDGSLLQLDSKYFFASMDDLRNYFSRHPMELMRSPLMAAVYAGAEENRYDLYRYFRSTDTWENVMQAVCGPKGAPGKHAALMIPEGSDSDEPGRENGVTTLPPGYKAWAKVKHVIGYESSFDSDAGSDSEDNAFALTFGIPQGADGIQGKRGHIPTVGNVVTNTIYPNQQAMVLINEDLYTDTEVTVRPTVPPTSRVDDVEFSTLNFRFDIPRGKTGHSPVISGGTWHTFNDLEEEYDTYYPARGDDGVSPIISNGNWWTAKKTGETADYEPIYQYVDTDVRAYGNNFLIITEPLVEGSNTYSINVFKNAQSRYGEAEVTLDSLVLSVSYDTYNAYGMITELGKDNDGKVTQVVVEYKGTAQGDMAVRMFSAGRRYPAGSLCFYEGTVYRAAVDIPAGSQFNPDQWSELVSQREIPQLEDFQPSDGSGIYLYGYHDAAVMDNTICRCAVYGFPQFDDCIFQFQTDAYGPVIWWEKQPAEQWKPQYGYSGTNKGDGAVPSFVLHGGIIWCCLEDHLSREEWDSAESEYWVQVNAWNSGAVYKRGDFVLYDNVPYFCINTPGQQSSFKASNLIWYPEGRITSLSALSSDRYAYGTIISCPIKTDGSDDAALYRVIDSYPEQPIWERKQFSVWTEGSVYNTGDFVFYETSIYKCIDGHVSGPWDQETDFWTLVPEWDINTAYAAGTDVAYNDQTSGSLTPFTCIAAAPAGALPSYDITLEPVMMDGNQVTIKNNSWAPSPRIYFYGDYVVLYGILFQCIVEETEQASFRMDDGSVAVWAAISGSSVSSAYSAGEGISISDNKISLRTASIAALGGVRVDGNTITVDRNGTLTVPSGRQYMKPRVIWHTGRGGSTFYYPELRTVTDPEAFSIYKNGTLLQLGVDYDFYPESHAVIFTVSQSVSDKIAVACGYASSADPLAAGYGINNSMFVNSRVIAVDAGVVPALSGGNGISYNSDTGEISLKPATLSAIGGVIPDGSTIGFDSNGKISAAATSYSGGDGIIISGGMVSVNYSPDSLELVSGQLAVKETAYPSYSAGPGISISGGQVSVNVDGTTISAGADGVLSAMLGGYVTSDALSSGLAGKQDVLAAGPGILLEGGSCSVRVDGTTISAGADGVLSAIGGSGGQTAVVSGENGISVVSSGGSSIVALSSALNISAEVLQVEDSWTREGNSFPDGITSMTLASNGISLRADYNNGTWNPGYATRLQLTNSGGFALGFGASQNDYGVGIIYVPSQYSPSSGTMLIQGANNGIHIPPNGSDLVHVFGGTGVILLDGYNIGSFISAAEPLIFSGNYTGRYVELNYDSSTLAVNSSGQLTVIGGSSGIAVDSEFSSSSTNPVQNKVIYDAIGDLKALLSSI